MLNFIHDKNLYSIEKEQLVTNIYLQIQNLILLPDQIEVEFRCMGPSSYGETILDSRRLYKRIILNVDLDVKALFYPTIHELVHVSQMHTGKLAISRTGVFVWENKTYPVDPLKMSYQAYQQLPWELDAHAQQKILGKKLLNNQ
jgi:hypothetical protein